ncbi:MAG: hypothetical protein HQL66_09530 [Magnetococcales bacterium]|nr:hypothetical protein [Magnetococcales bacterium]
MLKQTFFLGTVNNSNLDRLGNAADYTAFKKIFSRLNDEEIDQLARMAEGGLLSVASRRRMKQLIEEHKFLLVPRTMMRYQAEQRVN